MVSADAMVQQADTAAPAARAAAQPRRVVVPNTTVMISSPVLFLETTIAEFPLCRADRGRAGRRAPAESSARLARLAGSGRARAGGQQADERERERRQHAGDHVDVMQRARD